MKLFFNRDVFCQAFSLSTVKDKLTADSKLINEHVLKCVIYYDDLNCLSHWIDEITNWIYQASTVSSKHRISKKVYEKTVFGWFGEDIQDCRSNLYEFYSKFVKKRKAYPKFEISEQLVDQVYRAYRELESEIIDMYTSKYNYSKSDYLEAVTDILK